MSLKEEQVCDVRRADKTRQRNKEEQRRSKPKAQELSEKRTFLVPLRQFEAHKKQKKTKRKIKSERSGGASQHELHEGQVVRQGTSVGLDPYTIRGPVGEVELLA